MALNLGYLPNSPEKFNYKNYFWRNVIFLLEQIIEQTNMPESKTPTVVGINVLKQNGLDVEELKKLLIQNASVEFTAYYYFTNLRAHCTGLEGEGLKGIIEDARLEDLSHFESCLERIYQLGGSLPNDE